MGNNLDKTLLIKDEAVGSILIQKLLQNPRTISPGQLHQQSFVQKGKHIAT